MTKSSARLVLHGRPEQQAMNAAFSAARRSAPPSG